MWGHRGRWRTDGTSQVLAAHQVHGEAATAAEGGQVSQDGEFDVPLDFGSGREDGGADDAQSHAHELCAQHRAVAQEGEQGDEHGRHDAQEQAVRQRRVVQRPNLQCTPIGSRKNQIASCSCRKLASPHPAL